ncbi:hypothetical protein EDC02_7634 [Micromonospora sp. Llam0]|uniref:hypothetical protein n=1 Tax=Micromonospora sp. Llam0 TaxID=2485143 RepID=UPI000F476802|nr:hypothetical protein [Micromonospora sp. Llam0]ROO52694.1 hypothetical protein EDC02_7634 [Micromonospora sp. Llam0]
MDAASADDGRYSDLVRPPSGRTERMILELRGQQALVEEAVGRLAAVTRGSTHALVTEANVRLEHAGMHLAHAITASAGGVGRPLKSLIAVGVVGIVTWPVAAICMNLLGWAQGWAVLAAVLSFTMITYPLTRLFTMLDRLAANRRVRILTSGAPSSVAPPDDATGTRGTDGTGATLAGVKRQLDAVLDIVEDARAALRRTTDGYLKAHRYSAARNSDGGLAWLRERDPVLFHLMAADVLLCRVDDGVDLWASSIF